MQEIPILVIKAAVLLGAIFGVLIPLSILLERGWAAITTGRYDGAGGAGLVQTYADGLKLICKECVAPEAGDRRIFFLAPLVSLLPPLILLGLIPFGNEVEIGGLSITLQLASPSTATVVVVALIPLAAFGLIAAGWGSGHSYAQIAALNTATQVVSFGVAAGLAVAGVALVGGTMQLAEIVRTQSETQGVVPRWNLLVQPLGFVGLVAATFAFADRLPLDSGTSREMEGGYTAAYSGFPLGLLALAGRLRLLVASLLVATLYLGGWHLPFVVEGEGRGWVLLGVGLLLAKSMLFVLFMQWLRLVVPRPSMDQFAGWAWKLAVPLTAINIPITAYMLVYR